MNALLALGSLLALIYVVTAEPPECPDLATKEALKKYKVDKELTPLLKGNTYVDIWRRKGTTRRLDCSMTEYTENGDGLFGNMHNVQHGGSSLFFKDKLTENKGDSSFSSYGEYKEPGKDTLIFNEYVQFFYADQFALGYFSCDVEDKVHSFLRLRMAVSVRKDKQGDKAALESLKNAVNIMISLKHLMPDKMRKLKKKHCPEKV